MRGLAIAVGLLVIVISSSQNAIGRSASTQKGADRPAGGDVERFHAALLRDGTNPDVIEWATWNTFYYLDPKPERTVAAIRFFSEQGAFQRAQQPLAVFFGRVFAQNAKSLTEWIEDLRKEREDRQFLAALALWFSRVDGRDRLLQRLSEGGSPRLTKYVQELRADTAPDLTTLDARSPVELDMLWASFFATGDDRYVLRVIRALSAAPQDKSPAIVAAAARWSLTANARQHSAVLDVCRKEMPRQPEAVAAVLRDVVAKAESDRPTRKTP